MAKTHIYPRCDMNPSQIIEMDTIKKTAKICIYHADFCLKLAEKALKIILFLTIFSDKKRSLRCNLPPFVCLLQNTDPTTSIQAIAGPMIGKWKFSMQIKSLCQKALRVQTSFPLPHKTLHLITSREFQNTF